MMPILSEQARQDAIKACQSMQTTIKEALASAKLCEDLDVQGSEARRQFVQAVSEMVAEFSPKGD